MSSAIVTTTTTVTTPDKTVKAKRKAGGGRKKKNAGGEAPATSIAPAVTTPAAPAAPESKVAPATTIAAPVAKAKTPRINAHQLFADERKPKLKEAHPEAKANEIVKLLSAEWKALDGDKRADFEKRAAALKREYEAKQKAESDAAAAAAAPQVAVPAAAAAPAVGEEGGAAKKKKTKKRKLAEVTATTAGTAAPPAAGATAGKAKVKKESNGIKRPTSAYVYFTQHFKLHKKKEDTPTAESDSKDGGGGTESKMASQSQKMNAVWKAMSEVDKKPFQELAAKDKLRYTAAKEEYEAAHPKPEKEQTRAYSAYIIFTQKMREKLLKEDPKLKFREMGVKLGKKWTEIKDNKEARKEYDEERARQLVKFKKPETTAAADATTTASASA